MGILYGQKKKSETRNNCTLVNCKTISSEAAIWITEAPTSDAITVVLSKSSPKVFPQVLAALASSYINLALGAAFAFVTSTLNLLQKESSIVQINKYEISWIASCTSLGALLGSILSGPCMSLGRKTTIWFVSFPMLIAWVILATANNVPMFYISHLIFGICIGIGSDCSQVYISEMTHSNIRGALGCIPVAMFNFGTMTFYFLSLFDLYWNEMAWIGSLISVPASILPAFIPESPSYLASKCREKDTLCALKTLRGETWDIGPELIELMLLERPKIGFRSRIVAVRESSAIRPIFIVAIMRIFSRFSGLRAIQTYTQHILGDTHPSLSAEMSTFITGVVQFLSIIVACVILEHKSRHFFLLSSLGIMSFSLISLAIYLTLESTADAEIFGLIPVLCIALYMIANSLGIGPISGLILGELVPQRHRTIASSFTGCVSWLSAFLVTKTYVHFIELVSLPGTLYIYAGICILGIIFIIFFVPETRGKSQSEIENLFADNEVKTEK